MSLIKCKECGEEVSKNAAACPKCGNPIKKAATQYGCGTLIFGGVVAVILWAAFTSSTPRTPQTATPGVKYSKPTAAEPPGCSVANIHIKSMKAGFADKCRVSDCTILEGVAVLTNTCSEPVGVQLKITSLDKAGNPVSTRDFWPASIKNIPPGDYTFTLDQALDYNPAIKSFEISPIDVRKW